MRCFLCVFLCLFFVSAQAQLLNPASDWFESTSFFNGEVIKERGITDVHILIRDKADSKLIKDEGTFLHYEFDATGVLRRSLRGIKLSKGMDTAVVEYDYLYGNQLVRQREQQGRLSYTITYEYKDGLPYRTVKIDDNTYPKDTLYDRQLQSEKRDGKLIVNTLNYSGKPYLKEEKEYRNDTLIWQHISHVLNQTFTERKYLYEDGKLFQYQYITHFDRKKEAIWEYAYIGSLIEEATLFEEGERRKKRVFLYEEDNLPNAVIERDYLEKSIRIYNFLYHYK